MLTEDELAAFIADKDRFAKCRRLYMGHDLLPDKHRKRHFSKTRLRLVLFQITTTEICRRAKMVEF